MKNFKKIISLVLAICMIASLAISASAANTVDASGGTARPTSHSPAPQTAPSAATPQPPK